MDIMKEGIVGFVAGAASGYLLANIAPTHDINKKTAKIFVISCIDNRFADILAWFLTHRSDMKDEYDTFSLAGASLGGLQPNWKSVLFEHIRLAIKLHQIKEVWCFDHLDCGMYKATLNLKTDTDQHIHTEHLKKFKDELHQEFSELSFRGFVIDTSGNFHQNV
jgi:carbonic anhydrase